MRLLSMSFAQSPSAKRLFGLAAFANLGFVWVDSFWPHAEMGLWQWPSLVLMAWLAWPTVPRPVQVMIAGVGLVVIFLLAGGAMSPMQWAQAGSTASALSSFVLAISLLRHGASGSATVQRASHALIGQSPGRLYDIVSLGAHMLTLLVGFGAVALVVTSLQQANAAGQQVAQRASSLLKTSSLAAIRAYSAAFLWAPVTMPYALVHQAFPDVSWSALAPWAALSTLAYFSLGRYLCRRSPQVKPQPAMPRQSLNALWPLAALLASLGLLLAGLVHLSGLSLYRVLVLVALPLTLFWLLGQRRRNLSTAQGVNGLSALLGPLPAVAFQARTEICIGTVSATLGAVLLTQLDLVALNQALSASGWSPSSVLIGAMLMQVALAWVGINPFVTIYIAAHVLAQLDMLAHLHLAVVLMELFTAALISGFGPWTLPMQMTANVLRIPALTLAVQWNGRFSLGAMAIAMLALAFV